MKFPRAPSKLLEFGESVGIVGGWWWTVEIPRLRLGMTWGVGDGRGGEWGNDGGGGGGKVSRGRGGRE